MVPYYFIYSLPFFQVFLRDLYSGKMDVLFIYTYMTLTWDLIHNGISQESMASLIILFGPAIIFCPFFCTL